jgi:hypothetical protein
VSEKSASSDVEYARQLQEKFELYLLGLIFTLLALAIQTAKFGTDDIADALEIAGWIFLLASGLIGLWRIEWVPVTLQNHSELVKIKNELAQLKQAQAEGYMQIPVEDQEAPANVAELIADRKAAIETLEANVESLDGGIRRKYLAHKWSFVIGLILVVAARAYAPVQALNMKHPLSGTPAAATQAASRPQAH